MNVQILENGNLKLTLEDDDRAEIIYIEDCYDIDILSELTKSYWTNGSYEPFDAGVGNPNVGLTSAPCIAEQLVCLDDGTKKIIGRFWYYSDYMIKSFIDELVETGEVIFEFGGAYDE